MKQIVYYVIGGPYVSDQASLKRLSKPSCRCIVEMLSVQQSKLLHRMKKNADTI